MSSRGNFSSHIGFVLAATGSAVGLGNIWRFPYLAGAHGGAAFLLIYLVCVMTLCLPVIICEIAIGRNAATDAYGAYRKLAGKGWGALGILGICTGIVVLSYYNVVAGWAFGYFLEISFGNLLYQPQYEVFFYRYINDISDNFWFSFVFMALTALIVSRGIQKGIELANKIMMPALYLTLLGLIVYSLTLPNAMEGVKFYLVPDMSKITLQAMFQALKQAFFSLSLGMGALITYGSYLKKNQNIICSAALISLSDTSVAFFAGLMIFPMVASLGAYESQGPGLVFVTLTSIFSHMTPITGRAVGGLFFLFLCFAALTSSISLLEVSATYLVDQKDLPRKKTVWVVSFVIFILGIPSMLSQGVIPWLSRLPFYKGKDFLTFISDVCDISLTLGASLMCFAVVYRWGLHNLKEEVLLGAAAGQNSFVLRYSIFMIRYVCPWLLGGLSILIIWDNFFGLDRLSSFFVF